MGNCRFFTKTGLCGVETPGRIRKCEEHKDLRCQVCDRPAWNDCPDIGCEAVICFRSDCMEWHIEHVHNGKVTKPEPKPPHDNGGRNEPKDEKLKGEDVTSETDMCPFCEPAPTKRLLIKTWDRTNPRKNGKESCVTCLGCGMAGPRSTSRRLAIQYWGELPTKHLAPYEAIRVTALRIIEREMRILDELSLKDPLSNETQIALSKMLESATMAIDTWDL